MALDVHPQLLRALVVVLETGSLTAASERLGFTQSAVSKQMATLEATVGSVLVERGPRGVRPTAAAHRLLPHAVAVLDHLEAADRELRLGPQRQLEGRVALGGFPTAAMHLVPRALARLSREHPLVRVDFAELSSPVQLRRLRRGRLDLALVATGADLDLDLTDVEHEVLPSGPLLVAVPAEHRLAGRGRVDVEELRDERWVAARGVRGDPQFGPWPTLGDVSVVAELAGWTARLGFVAAGLGITTLPSLAAPAVPAGVVVLEVDDPTWRGRALEVAHLRVPSLGVRAVRASLVAVARELAARG